MTDQPLTLEEVKNILGIERVDQIPTEILEIIWRSDSHITIGQIREEIRLLAAKMAGLKDPQPMQRIVRDAKGTFRFKENKIVTHLLDNLPYIDMNSLATLPFSDEDRCQFAQLIGYSVRGYLELPYVSDKDAHDISVAMNEFGE